MGDASARPEEPDRSSPTSPDADHTAETEPPTPIEGSSVAWSPSEAADIALNLDRLIGGMNSTIADPDHPPPKHVDGPPSTIEDPEAATTTELGSPSSETSRFLYQGCVAPGTVIDNYEVIELIGWGGMGEVYRARHKMADFDQVVALKIIRRSVWDAEIRSCDAERLIARFYQEMRAASAVRDDHVVPVLNAGVFVGFPYYVMMLVDGESLSKRLKAGRTTPSEAAALLLPIARAVQNAHSKRIIHRDIKPSNIIVDKAGKPYLTDFGLAKMFEQALSHTLTTKDVLMGTPQYIPPEQIRSAAKVDARCDVYSLGATLYEMLTGRPPFTGDDSMAVVLRVLNDPLTPPHRLNPEVPEELERICVRCLEKDPDRRFPTAGELADELERFLRGVPIETRPPTWLDRTVDWIRARPVVAALLTAVAASVVLGLISTTIQLRRARWALHELARHDSLLSLWRVQAAIDAGREAEAAAELQACPEEFRDWEWRFFDRLRRREQTRLRGHPGEVYGLVFRPGSASELVAAGRRGAAWIWDRTTGDKRGELFGLKPEVDVFDVAWARTAGGVERIAAACSDERVRVWTRSGGLWGTPRELKAHRGRVQALAISSDGKRMATSGDDGRLLLWDLDEENDAPARVLVQGGPTILAVAFDAAGDGIVSVGEGGPPRIWSLSTDKSSELSGTNSPAEPRLAVAVSPSGRLVAAGGANGTISIWDVVAGGPPREFQWNFGAINALVFSPNERRLVSADSDGVVTFFDVATWEKVLERHAGDDAVEALAFSDDGRSLASAGGDGVLLWESDPWVEPSVPPPRRFDGGGGAISGVAVRRDGREVAAAGSDGSIRIWSEPDGKLAHVLNGHKMKVTALAYSPDGARLASIGRAGDVRVWSLAGASPSSALDGVELGRHEERGIALALGSDGRTLVTGGADRQIMFWDLDAGARTHQRTAPDQVYCLALSADGRLLASAGGDKDGAISIWENRPGDGWALTRTLRGHTRQVNALAFAPTGRRLASVSHDRTARVWDLDRNDDSASVLRWRVSRAWGVAWSQDGLIATAGGDRTVRLWDPANGDEKAVLHAHTGQVRSVAFDPSSRYLASGGDDGQVYLWNADVWRSQGR